jgi:tellurite resistance protein TerC
VHVTPAFLCLAAIVAADIAFAVDSIPAAFAITRDALIIWMGNVFALVGLRSLFVLVEGLIRRFRYLDQTIAVVLGLIAVKLLLEPVVKIGPVASLAGVALAFAVGIGASLIGDKRDPEGAEERRARNGEPAPAGRPDG